MNSRLPLLLAAALAGSSWTACPAAAPAAPVPASIALPATDDGLPGIGPIRRYDWFQEVWNRRRSEWAKRVDQDQHAIVFLGDSITQGWGDDFGGRFPGLKVANRGISGDTTRGLLLRLAADVLALHPTGLVLLIGTNDLEENAPPETPVANLRLLLAQIHAAAPALPVVLCEVMPSSATMHRPAEAIQRINLLLRAVVRDYPQVTYLDTWTLFANAQGDAKPEEFPDLLHPNDAGYAKWKAALLPVFATLGWTETEPDSFTPEPGFVSLFNGRDLTGWGFRPTSPEDIKSAQAWQRGDPNAAAWPIVTTRVSFAGQPATPDGRYVARHGRLVVTTPPEYRRIQQLWTTREFGHDFILRLEFRATPNTDSGIYVRGPQLQCRDYLLAGPYDKLQHYRPQDWNAIEVVVHGNTARCTCNGELLEEAMPVPASGPIGLEGDRGQMEYRRIRIQELP